MGKMKAGPVVTDNGCVTYVNHTHCKLALIHSIICRNFVIDAVFSEAIMKDPTGLLHKIKMSVDFNSLRFSHCFAHAFSSSFRLTGVLEVGIFAGMALAAYFGNPVRFLISSHLVFLLSIRNLCLTHQDGTVTVRWNDGRTSTMSASEAII